MTLSIGATRWSTDSECSHQVFEKFEIRSFWRNFSNESHEIDMLRIHKLSLILFGLDTIYFEQYSLPQVLLMILVPVFSGRFIRIGIFRNIMWIMLQQRFERKVKKQILCMNICWQNGQTAIVIILCTSIHVGCNSWNKNVCILYYSMIEVLAFQRPFRKKTNLWPFHRSKANHLMNEIPVKVSCCPIE